MTSIEEAFSTMRLQTKVEVCAEIVRRLRAERHDITDKPGFELELEAHFNRLPTRYALDVNVERAEDVVMHKRLLELAEDAEVRPVFHLRVVQVQPRFEDASGSPASTLNAHPPPAFGSSSNLQALEASFDLNEPSEANHHREHGEACMHEIAISTVDKPKLLSQLSAWLADVGLNIHEAHAFSTRDGYSLDVFVVTGWSCQDTGGLRVALERSLSTMERKAWSRSVSPSPGLNEYVLIPSDGKDDWEIDKEQLKLLHKVASGSFGDLYRGTYCGQDVAIKILKRERLNEDLQKEFAQEVSILRKVRHKNVVQFIGACTMSPNLCIVTEFMSGGSVYDYIHRHPSVLKLPMVLKVAIDISKGMDYLHQSNIIHRDLKAANLLMDENEVVKVADFGVARVKDQTGIMTAETGTYRWMAPEVIEHKPYDHKADVFSFGIVLWELLNGKVPYDYLSPLQAAVAVVQKGLRPLISKDTHPKLSVLMENCWESDPTQRPEFSEVTQVLQDVYKEVGEGESGKRKEKKSGIFSAFKRNH